MTWNIKLNSISFNKCILEVWPIDQTIAITMANSLRRILLSNTEGLALIAFNIDGIVCETQTIPGIREDLTSLILNFKRLRFSSDNENLNLSKAILCVNKHGIITSDHINTQNNLKIIKTQHLLYKVDNSKLRIELIIAKGKGYLTTTQLKTHFRSQLTGHIIIDACFSPISQVSYNITESKFDNKEKLTMLIETNGCICAKTTLKNACKTLITMYNNIWNNI